MRLASTLMAGVASGLAVRAVGDGSVALVCVAVALALAAGYLNRVAWVREKWPSVTGRIGYIYPGDKARLHLDDCPTMPLAQEGDEVRVWVQPMRRGAKGDK